VTDTDMPYPHRHQFGLPFSECVAGIGSCAVIVGKSYLLCGGGYIYSPKMPNSRAVLANGELYGGTNPWCLNLTTKHQGRQEREEHEELKMHSFTLVRKW
jgi:hypothetical protein